MPNDPPAAAIEVTKPIPMKRELIVDIPSTPLYQEDGHKANPDEKGTESRINDCMSPSILGYCHKANPDEKGTESAKFRGQRIRAAGHKANPDEKGTERQHPEQL